MKTADLEALPTCKGDEHEWSAFNETCQCGVRRVVDTGDGIYTLEGPETAATTVKWVDSSLQNGQVDRHGFPKPATITTVGFVVDETDEYITLARDDMGDGDYRGLCCIPKIAVLPS